MTRSRQESLRKMPEKTVPEVSESASLSGNGSIREPREGQAGHKKAWSKGGKTRLNNGKWQCRECNLQEGANSQ